MSENPDRATRSSIRDESHPRLEALAQRVDARGGWDDLVLPEAQRLALHEIVVEARNRLGARTRSGAEQPGSHGFGITVVFAGERGTGKTRAAQVIARELGLALYRIDLASVAGKYIGETEKNLRHLFDAASASGAILLFDEADALFGKRSEVKDSHDRYANIEIAYLMQRMEEYRGVAILTTSSRHAIDAAVRQRPRFIVHFPSDRPKPDTDPHHPTA